jgi:predicted Zn-dependent protease
VNSPTSYPAVFFDGVTNDRRLVAIETRSALAILDDDTPLASWPYRDIRSVDSPAGLMRLCCVSAPPLARLELRDPDAQRAVADLCPGLQGPGGSQPVSARRIAAWSLAAAAVIVGMIWFGMPFVADQLTELLPVRWEKPLGQAVDGQIRVVFSGAACTDPAGQAALGKLVASLQAGAQLAIPPDPVVLRSTVPNAFAVPGGRVYILSELIGKARSPDELGGVLAHEFGHIAHRDGIRRLIRDGGTGFLVGLLFGDVSGGGAILFATRSLLSDAYSREVEAGADSFAVTVLHRLGRPTAPLGALLGRLTGPEEMEFSLLRDHPLTPDRERMLAAENRPPTGPSMLSPAEWQALKGICR